MLRKIEKSGVILHVLEPGLFGSESRKRARKTGQGLKETGCPVQALLRTLSLSLASSWGAWPQKRLVICAVIFGDEGLKEQLKKMHGPRTEETGEKNR